MTVIADLLPLLGLVVPPAVDFIRKKFLPAGADTPEATVSTLATTAPERLGEYVNAQAALFHARLAWFNRDISGAPSSWVVDLRACIRPVTVILTPVLWCLHGAGVVTLEPEILATVNLNISSWFGSRIG